MLCMSKLLKYEKSICNINGIILKYKCVENEYKISKNYKTELINLLNQLKMKLSKAYTRIVRILTKEQLMTLQLADCSNEVK